MKKTKFTETQIVFALKQAETGVAIAGVYVAKWVSEKPPFTIGKKHGSLGVTCINWKKKIVS
ncbi:hypothetical protein G8759_33155 [Spirosoma aureum]|uniref:Transposase n=1 Tax=Spirosoma aureum TaxID=2692134 RepID=A0A6G9AFB9_9BACT|nr:hypothetical protein [Spirosoma aureum]QIP11140.1 hypothetical protein G8759_33155 [Spirosoma aureum]